MALDVDLTELHLAAAKMGGLESYLNVLRKSNKGFDEALALAKEFCIDNGGTVNHSDSTTTLCLFDVEAHCFQPYPDINKFYFEI